MGRPLAWRMGKGRRREGASVPWFIFKYLSFGCCQSGFLDETSLGMEDCANRSQLPLLVVALFVIVFRMQPGNIRLSVLGRRGFLTSGSCPVPSLGIGSATWISEKLVDPYVSQRVLCEFPLKRSCFG